MPFSFLILFRVSVRQFPSVMSVARWSSCSTSSQVGCTVCPSSTPKPLKVTGRSLAAPHSTLSGPSSANISSKRMTPPPSTLTRAPLAWSCPSTPTGSPGRSQWSPSLWPVGTSTGALMAAGTPATRSTAL